MQIAVQLFASGEHIDMPGGRQQLLWGSDPWALLEACRPGMMPPGDRIAGVGIGARVLCNLVAQVGQIE